MATSPCSAHPSALSEGGLDYTRPCLAKANVCSCVQTWTCKTAALAKPTLLLILHKAYSVSTRTCMAYTSSAKTS